MTVAAFEISGHQAWAVGPLKGFGGEGGMASWVD